MTITVDSSQWTGEQRPTTPIVWGEFPDDAARAAAMAGLQAEGAVLQPTEQANNEAEQADLQNRRQLGVGTAMAATALGAAGLVIASGGAMLPAILAAAAAGAGAGVAGEAVAATVEAPDPEQPPSPFPLIGLHAPDDATRQKAEQILLALGARKVIATAA